MLEWIPRGLRRGIVTTRFPAGHERPPAGFHGPIEIVDTGAADRSLERLCPTDAIRVRQERVSVDRGRCIQCGACVAAAPDRFRFARAYETAARQRSALVAGDDSLELEPLRRTLAEQVRALRRSVHIRHVDAGSDGAEEWEIAALANPHYDMQRLGLFFTSAPRHADVLLVSGGVTHSMVEPLRRCYEVMPAPKVVVAAGTDACSGGFAAASGEVAGGVDQVLAVDVYVPGSPPSPIALLHGLLLAVGALSESQP